MAPGIARRMLWPSRHDSARGSATLALDPMAPRRVVTGLALAAAITVAVAGCGSGGAGRTPQLSALPLASGVRVMTNVRQCNGGSNAYCAVELVVLGPSYRSPRALVLEERDRLRAAGWVGASPTTGDQLANESPNNQLRVTYTTAFEDLKGADLGWIKRSWPTISALDQTLFSRRVAMSVLLEIGSH